MLRFNALNLFLSGSAAFFVMVLITHFGTPDGLSGVRAGISGAIVRESIKGAMAKSERLWAKTVKQRHEVYEKFGEMGFFPARNTPTYFDTPYSVWDLVPASWDCPYEVERIGRMGDGGKWVCGMSQYEKNKGPFIIYSFGIQNESSFEQEMLERTNCEIWGYDFSVDAFGPVIGPAYRHRTHFTKAGIAGVTNEKKSPPFYSIQDLMAKNGHDHIDILKIDIEGYEFEVISSLLKHASTSSESAFPIGQMLLEIHLFNQAGTEPSKLGAFLDWWESMENAGIRPTWTEPNLLAVTLKLWPESMPILAEYSLVNVNDPKNLLW